jgi:acetylornithine deacetylase/succinyl-diaminopimelate desuccinylase-like protein
MRAMISAAVAVGLALPAMAQDGDKGQARFRALYKELVETNTSLSSGDCTLAARKMAAHLKAAGYPDSDLHVFTAPDHPKEGGLVAVLHGSDAKAKAVLLLGHLDVVEARRADWTRDPFTLIEENGYFYGRGTADMKAQVAAWVDTLVRLKEENFKHTHDIKMALTCGEETSTAFNGAGWLATKERSLIDAAFALNEGGGGRLDEKGKPLALTIQAAEKYPQNYTLEVTNPGGHSSRPMPDNAIYRLAIGLTKINGYRFPIKSSEITRAYFAKMSPQVGGEKGAAMAAFAKNPDDTKAAEILAKDPSYNAVLHTTCIPTLLNAGHANNALPQRADANINCRIFPGTKVEEVRAKLQELVADPQIKVTVADKRSEVPKGPQPLTPQIVGPVEQVATKLWPGVPVVPFMSAGATDGAFLAPAGIPTYGVSGMFGDPDGNGAHGLNERLRVSSVYKGRDFLYEVVKIYANQN